MSRPTALGLLVCEQIIVARDNGRRTFVGAFDHLTGDAVPWTAPSFTVYVALTDGQGPVELVLQVTDIDEEVELVSDTLRINLPSPLAIAHVRFRVRDLVLPAAGQYLFQLLVDEESICHRRLHLFIEEE